MRIFIFFFLFIVSAANLSASKIDKAFLKKITGTKWALVEEKKSGNPFAKKTKPSILQEITFTTGAILFDTGDQHYECSYTIKEEIEFWMYCKEPDQYIYKIHSLSTLVLVVDMLVKDKDGKYVKRKRMTYHRKG